MSATKLIVALDTNCYETAEKWVQALEGRADAIKLGMEFVYRCGFEATARLARGRKLFLDLKLHDIPNTVAQGIRSLSEVHPAFLTIHAAGGAEMISAARDAIDTGYPAEARPLLLAVTVLTSLDQTALAQTGVDAPVAQHIVHLAKLAVRFGADGIVCSAHEAALLRRELGSNVKFVVPGIRPNNAPKHDQKRIMTPAQAAHAGADWIVVGRPITQAASVKEAADAIQAELSAA